MAAEYSTPDNEEILTVFARDIQESWKENPDAMLYLSELSSTGLQRLHQEPERLAEEKAAILEQTQDLAFHNYKTFIGAAECSHEIFQDFNVIEQRLESTIKKLPKFSDKCQEFAKHALSINTRWHEASLTLKKHPQLLEFLEMPQLMDTYVRNSLYEEALELASYIKRLDRKHGKVPLIAGIVKSIQETLNVLLLQLLDQLRVNIQLPACLKVIGFLRRMDIFSELELRIKFLQARSAWFHDIISKISSDDPYQHIIKVIEVSRMHLFDIITQYRAIFSDDDPVLVATKDTGQNEASIFHSWITLQILDFLKILQNDLKANLGGKIDSVFGQCMYFGSSFSRVGIDFRPLLVPIFEQAVLMKFNASIQEASCIFAQSMQSYTITNYSITNPASVMASSAIPDDSLHPPSSLLDFHPLAQYCNNILQALNELKLCSSFSIAPAVVLSLENSLTNAVSIIIDFETKERDVMVESERDIFAKFCVQFAEELIPHMEKCLDVIFPKTELAAILGVTPLEFNKLGSAFFLNTSAVLQPLSLLLPPKVEEEDDDVGITLTVKVPSSETEVEQEELEEEIVTNTEESGDDVVQ